MFITSSIGLVFRNPYVTVGIGILHGLGHMFKPGHNPAGPSFTEWITGTYDSSSPGGGGPGQSPISTTPPLSLEATGAILEQLGKPGGPASSSKRRSRPRRNRCPAINKDAPRGWLMRCKLRRGHRGKHRFL